MHSIFLHCHQHCRCCCCGECQQPSTIIKPITQLASLTPNFTLSLSHIDSNWSKLSFRTTKSLAAWRTWKKHSIVPNRMLALQKRIYTSTLTVYWKRSKESRASSKLEYHNQTQFSIKYGISEARRCAFESLHTSHPSWTYGTVSPVRESYALDSNL